MLDSLCLSFHSVGVHRDSPEEENIPVYVCTGPHTLDTQHITTHQCTKGTKLAPASNQMLVKYVVVAGSFAYWMVISGVTSKVTFTIEKVKFVPFCKHITVCQHLVCLHVYISLVAAAVQTVIYNLYIFSCSLIVHHLVAPETHYLKKHLFDSSSAAALWLCFTLPALWPDGCSGWQL